MEMAGNGAGSSSRGGGASINAAAAAVGSADARFPIEERVCSPLDLDLHLSCALFAIVFCIAVILVL